MEGSEVPPELGVPEDDASSKKLLLGESKHEDGVSWEGLEQGVRCPPACLSPLRPAQPSGTPPPLPTELEFSAGLLTLASPPCSGLPYSTIISYPIKSCT